jgi:hypothetical protein
LPLFAQQTPTQFCVVDGHKMEYQVAGKSGPVVVFENGHGEPCSRSRHKIGFLKIIVLVREMQAYSGLSPGVRFEF